MDRLRSLLGQAFHRTGNQAASSAWCLFRRDDAGKRRDGFPVTTAVLGQNPGIRSVDNKPFSES
jgi:hypothetical protein